MNPFDKLTPEALNKIREYAQALSPDGPLILQLCDEIDALDEALSASEDEVERLRAKAEPQAVSGSVSKLESGLWQVRWRALDGKRRSRTFDRRRTAELFLAEAKVEGRR